MTVDPTAAPERESLSMELELPHRPEKVWRALTEPDLLAEWLLPVIGLELTPGAEFTLKAEPQPGWDGVVHCRMLEIEPGRKLSYAWIVGDIDTVVTFTLEPAEQGTRLSVVQAGFRPDQRRNLGGARYGWKMMTGKLADLLERVP
jgi:uncharacterized protein YndB with AHSA1/START domain